MFGKDNVSGANTPLLSSNGKLLVVSNDWNLTVVTGTLGDNVVTNAACRVMAVRVGGTANTVGATQVKNGGVVVETLAAASTPGTGREYYGANFTALTVNLGAAADVILVFWMLV